MKLGVDLYSVRSQGWGAFQCLDYCYELGVDLVHFSEPEMLESLDDGYLSEVKARADEMGLVLEAGMGSICPTSASYHERDGMDAVAQVEQMLHVAQVLDSPVLRCFMGTNADRWGKVSLSEHMDATVATCQAVRELALDLGIKLAIENHAGDLQGRELKALIEQAGPDFVGACIDSGNPVWVAEDPLVTLEHLAPYVVTSHVRDSAVWSHPQGAAVQWVAMGEGNVAIETWTARFKALCPDTPYTLEIITGRPAWVLHYMEPDYWEAFPDARASELVRFERLVRAGEPFSGTMVTFAEEGVPEAYQEAKVVQQRYDLERSIAYCRETLGIGERA
jgi:sugar phosphate isomerase/epimerase